MSTHAETRRNETPQAAREPGLPRVERAVGLLETLLLLMLHALLLWHAGGLWRDEANTVYIATRPAWSEVTTDMEHDSFPIVWFVVVRAWAAVCGADFDFGLRVLGCLMGCSLIAVLWWNGKQLGFGVPLISLTLFAASPAVLTVGDSLRAYAACILALLILLPAMWKLTQQLTVRRVAVAGLAAVLSVQTSYHNCPLLLGTGLAASAVFVSRREWKHAAVPLGLGLIAALSLIPYLSGIAGRASWSATIVIPLTLSRVREVLGQIITPGWPLATSAILVGLGLTLPLLAWMAGKAQHSVERELACYLGLAVGLSLAAHAVFLKVLSYPTEIWYYLAPLALAAINADAASELLARYRPSFAKWRLALSVLVGVLGASAAWNAAHLRRTNIDLVAAQVAAHASPTDVIAVVPWHLGVSFFRYYHGPAPWTMFPALPHSGIHRYDLMMEKMTQPDPDQDVLDKCAETLRNGRRVWLIGQPMFLQPGQTPAKVLPAPQMASGWQVQPYYQSWAERLTYTLQVHSSGINQLVVEPQVPVSHYENVGLYVFEGAPASGRMRGAN